MISQLLSPHEFSHIWGVDKLIRLPDEPEPHPVPPDALLFLNQAGLPALITCRSGPTESKITFSRLQAGLSPLLEAETVGPPMPKAWSDYLILGDEFFCNGSAWWCIHQHTGHILRIDIELEEPIEFASSSVRQFASALAAVTSWAEQ